MFISTRSLKFTGSASWHKENSVSMWMLFSTDYFWRCSTCFCFWNTPCVFVPMFHAFHRFSHSPLTPCRGGVPEALGWRQRGECWFVLNCFSRRWNGEVCRQVCHGRQEDGAKGNGQCVSWKTYDLNLILGLSWRPLQGNKSG